MTAENEFTPNMPRLEILHTAVSTWRSQRSKLSGSGIREGSALELVRLELALSSARSETL